MSLQYIELHQVNSILILLLLLFSLLIISIGRDLLTVFTDFWNCFLFLLFGESHFTSLSWPPVACSVPQPSNPPLTYGIGHYMQRPTVGNRNAGSYISTVRGYLLYRWFPRDFILEKLGIFFLLPDASSVNRGKISKQELGSQYAISLWCLLLDMLSAGLINKTITQ